MSGEFPLGIELEDKSDDRDKKIDELRAEQKRLFEFAQSIFQGKVEELSDWVNAHESSVEVEEDFDQKLAELKKEFDDLLHSIGADFKHTLDNLMFQDRHTQLLRELDRELPNLTKPKT